MCILFLITCIFLSHKSRQRVTLASQLFQLFLAFR